MRYYPPYFPKSTTPKKDYAFYFSMLGWGESIYKILDDVLNTEYVL